MAVEQYRQYIRQLLSERAKRASRQRNAAEYEVKTVFDSEPDHYQLLYVGWRRHKRDFGCILHVDIKDGTIWIQHDGTEEGLANRLVEMGVPKQGAGLGIKSVDKRITQHMMNHHVGAKHSGDNLALPPEFSIPNASPFPKAIRAKHLETDAHDYPIDSRPNASPLRIRQQHHSIRQGLS